MTDLEAAAEDCPEWEQPGFVNEVRAWIGSLLPQITDASPWEMPHARPWSAALWFEAGSERFWVKANGRGTAHEGALVQRLGELVPALVPEVVAVHPERPWFVTRHAGPVVGADKDLSWKGWQSVLTSYGEAQLMLTDHVDTLVEEGTPVASPRSLPFELRALVTELVSRPPKDGGLDKRQAKALERLYPTFDSWCAELAHGGPTDSLNHDDLHAGNLCGGSEGMRLVDWGDATVGHPFGVLLTTLESVARGAGTDLSDGRVKRLRDGYLETLGGNTKQARRSVKLALRTGCVVRAMAWERAYDGVPQGAQAEFGWPVRSWLLRLVEDR